MTTEQALAGITKHLELIYTQAMWSDPEALSTEIVKLAIYNSQIANEISILHKKATDKSYMIFVEAKSSGAAVTQASAMARGESTEERESFEHLKNIYKAVESVISVVQTRIRVIQGEIRSSGYQTEKPMS